MNLQNTDNKGLSLQLQKTNVLIINGKNPEKLEVKKKTFKIPISYKRN